MREKWTTVLIIILSLKTFGAQTVFKKSVYTKLEWPRIVYKETGFPVNSKVECMALCRVEQSLCSGIMWKDSNCFLGDPKSQFSLLPSPQASDEDVFIDLGMVSWLLNPYLHLEDPIVNHWNARTYLTVPKDSLMRCVLECESDNNCQMFTFSEGLCHLGSGVVFNQTVSSVANPPEGVYVDQEFINTTGSLQLFSDINTTWTNHIYYSNTCNGKEQCDLWCLLESSPCQFTTFAESICYLGATNLGNGSVNTALESSSVEVWINRNGVENTQYEIVFSENITSTKYAPFIFKARNVENFQQSCEFYCALQTNPVCHFFFLSTSICYLGNMDKVHPSISSSTNSEVIHMYQPTLNSPVGEFITIQLSHHIWRAKMHTQLETNTTVGACAIRCRLLTFPKDCNIYVYDGTTCYFGNNDHFANVDTTHDINDVQVHELLLPYKRTLFKPRTTTDWASQMYKKVTLTNPISRHGDECLLRCDYDDGPCYSFVIQGNDCYLGDPFVNSSLFTTTGTAVIMEMNPKLHVIHGGRVNGSDEKSSTIFQGFLGFCESTLPELPLPLHSMGYAYGEDAIFVCGGTNGIDEQDLCYRMNFNEFPRVWVPLPPLMNTQVMFPMLYHEGVLYATGGLSNGSYIIPNMRFLNLESSSWTNGANNAGLFAHCGLLYQDRIYTFGGASDLEPYSRAVEVYKIGTDSWLISGFTLPQGLRHLACSLVLGQRATLPDLFLLAGGETVLGEYSRKAYSIDPTSNGIVNEMFDLPLGVSQFGSQNSFAVFHETNVFLAVGFGNGSHSTKSVLNWDRWGSKFSVLYDQTLAREHPGNAMIPLRNFPACGLFEKPWKMLVHHVKPLRYPIDGWNLNSLNQFHQTHSQIDILDNYSCAGQYHFRLVYPELGTYNEWYQTNNPNKPSSVSVTGFIGVALGMPMGFNGLVYNNVDALMMGDSNTTHPQWFSVGRIKADSSSGEFPGPQNTFVSSMRLFIRDDCAT